MRRAALPACPASGSIYEALADILTRVLGLRVVEAHDNLFDLGANSITIIQIAARIERRFAIDVPSSAIFDRPTLAELAAYLRERLGGDAA
ncbi:MAG TPA: acyl carrier protein [Casimicrobiaceae bacterium]|nr:acyl carrier protein [Casimicrobiaceae bacterium]